MQRRLKVVAIVVAGLILVSIFYLYITRDNPVLYRSEDRALAEPDRAFLIQNPFRERGPEDEAEKLLQDIKAGNCEKALTLPASNPETVARTCEKEGSYRIQDWSITNRQDIGKQVILVYKVYRTVRSDTEPASTQNFHGLAWIDVEKVGEERWRVLSYQTYY